MADKKKIRLNYDRLVQYAMVAATIVLISLLYPSNVKFKYEFQKGQTWRYEDLRAPFDFAIQKPEEEVNADRSQLIREFSPYYRLNPGLAGAKKSDFIAFMERWYADAGLRNDTIVALTDREEVKELCGRLLGNVFSIGIIDLYEEHKDKNENFVINVVQGNTIYKRTLSSFLTEEDAQQEMKDSLDHFSFSLPPVLERELYKAVIPNIRYESELTQKMKEEALEDLVTTKGMVKQGDLIVQRGNLITEDVYEKLVSIREKYATNVGTMKSSRAVYFGYLLITILIFVALLMYINSYLKALLLNWRHLAFILMWILVFSYLTFLLERMDAINAYVVPFCIVPVVVSHFFSFRLAFFTHVMVVLVAGFLTTLGFPFLFMQMIAGVVAVLAVADARDWNKFFKSVLAIVLAYALSFYGVSVIEEGRMLQVDWTIFGLIFLNGLLTFLAFPLIPLVEKIFGFTSSISLVELSDMNRPLLRELAIKAPGTLQHSLQVGNLSEAAASEIGADALLVKVAALYHDVGKMVNPNYFVENQGLSNPHDNLDPVKSAEIIIGHVTEGVRLAKKQKLPRLVTRFIITHHGTTRVEYFYKTYLQNNPGITVDVDLFTYPGPKPTTKEEAILMLADTVEAASRALKNPTAEDIDALVDKLVGRKVAGGQLDESNLTFGDFAICKEVFKKRLKSVHHVRIQYPD